MKTEAQSLLLRIYVNESDRVDGRALYETVVRAARESGLAGATVLRAIEGFGAAGRVHSVKVLHLSDDVPIVVEIIDTPERVAAFLPTLDKLLTEGIVTVEEVRTLTYRRDNATATSAPIDDEIQLESSDFSPVAERSQAVESRELFAKATDRSRQIIDAAKRSAAKSRRVYIDSVDVLLALLNEPSGIAEQVLRKLGVESQLVVRSLRDSVIRDETSDIFASRLDEKSVAAAKWLDKQSSGSEHLLLAICQIRPSTATDILTRLGAQPRDICSEVLEILGHSDDWQRWLADHPDM